VRTGKGVTSLGESRMTDRTDALIGDPRDTEATEH
jgi:hypothetical protein